MHAGVQFVHDHGDPARLMARGSADWRGEGASTSSIYRSFALDELRELSPSYARLCSGVAEDPDLLAMLTELPPPKRQPNLLLATVRLLGGPITAYPAFRSFVLDRRLDVLATMRERRTQTNEPLRCASLLPVLAGLPQPLALIEVGASAGLCLLPDRYRYRYATPRGGEHVVGDGPVELRCTVTGRAPLPLAVPEVGWRRGLDLHPLDVADEDDARWLECLIWPEEIERFGRLRAALEVARADPPVVERGDLVHDLAGLLEQIPAGATPVVMHSAVLAYVDAPGRAAFADLMRTSAAERGVIWVSNEAPGIVPGTAIEVDHPTFVLARDTVPVALADGHGTTLDWL